MIVDAHQHFWKLDRGDYSWLTPDLDSLYRDYLPADYQPFRDAHGITKTVLVQAADSEAEAEFLLSLAETVPFVAGVVGWLDMEARGAVARLEAFARNPNFLGVRPMIQDIADDDWMLRPVLAPVYQTLAEKDLVFEALVHERHLAHLDRLTDRHPDLRVIVDHGAKPRIDERRLASWKAALSPLARKENVYCKLSGLVTEAGESWVQEDILPYAEFLLDAFGPARLLWGSDWPVVNLAGGFDEWWAVTEAFLSGLEPEARSKVLHDTAVAVYRLDREHL